MKTNTPYNVNPDQTVIAKLEGICGSHNILTDNESRLRYGSDETEDFSFPPAVVVKPGSTEEVAAVLKLAYDNNIPVTPAGARTGLSGGALPLMGGILLSMERFNRVLEVDEKNLQVTTQPGVITEVLQNLVAEKGLFYPPDPASKGSCFIGGNVAENSGGPRAVKYGVVKDYVLNLEVVLPDGEIIQTGANVLKNATGYNLTQLFVGSEGTLGVVTKITLRLIPLPRLQNLMWVPFPSAINACAAVAGIFRAGFTPSAMEFMERDAVDLVIRYNPELAGNEHPEAGAFLLIEMDGNDSDLIMESCASVADVLQQYDCGEIAFADSSAEKERLWAIRRRAGEAVKRHSIYKEEDTVVPRAMLPELLKYVKELGHEYGFESYCYGHAGDGNLHVNIVKGDLDEAVWEEHLETAIRKLFTRVVELGGTISAEHGIGYVQQKYMDIAFSPRMIELQRAIKDVFDPKGIMNPGKVLPRKMG